MTALSLLVFFSFFSVFDPRLDYFGLASRPKGSGGRVELYLRAVAFIASATFLFFQGSLNFVPAQPI